jgi:hypothetical protein
LWRLCLRGWRAWVNGSTEPFNRLKALSWSKGSQKSPPYEDHAAGRAELGGRRLCLL